MDTSTGGADRMAIKNKTKDLKDKANKKKELLKNMNTVIDSAKTIEELKEVLKKIVGAI